MTAPGPGSGGDPAAALLAEVAALATALGPAVEPPGSARVLTTLTATARAAFGAQACSLALLDEDDEELVYAAADGSGAAEVVGLRMPATRGIAGWVVASGQPVAISDVRGDPRFARDVAEGTGYVPTAILAAPVQSQARLLGVLTVLDRDVARPGADQDLQLVQVFADSAAVAVDAARAFSDLGRVLLGALAVAAGDGPGGPGRAGVPAPTGAPASADGPGAPGGPAPPDGRLLAALEDAATRLPRRDADLARLAALFAGLATAGPAERALALQVVGDVLAYARGSRRPGA